MFIIFILFFSLFPLCCPRLVFVCCWHLLLQLVQLLVIFDGCGCCGCRLLVVILVMLLFNRWDTIRSFPTRYACDYVVIIHMTIFGGISYPIGFIVSPGTPHTNINTRSTRGSLLLLLLLCPFIPCCCIVTFTFTSLFH